MEIKLTKEQLNNLKAFLGRVELKGVEVPVFVDIINALNVPLENDDNGKV